MPISVVVPPSKSKPVIPAEQFLLEWLKSEVRLARREKKAETRVARIQRNASKRKVKKHRAYFARMGRSTINEILKAQAGPMLQ
jgi:predicted nucleotidyltransferase